MLAANDAIIPVRVELDRFNVDREGKAPVAAQESGKFTRFPVRDRFVRAARLPSDCQVCVVQFAGSSVDIA